MSVSVAAETPTAAYERRLEVFNAAFWALQLGGYWPHFRIVKHDRNRMQFIGNALCPVCESKWRPLRSMTLNISSAWLKNHEFGELLFYCNRWPYGWPAACSEIAIRRALRRLWREQDELGRSAPVRGPADPDQVVRVKHAVASPRRHVRDSDVMSVDPGQNERFQFVTTNVKVDSSPAFDEMMSRLEKRGAAMRGKYGEIFAQCQHPAHDDHNPSLGITWVPRRGGSLLINCISRYCDKGEILAQLGMTFAMLYDDYYRKDPSLKGNMPITEVDPK